MDVRGWAVMSEQAPLTPWAFTRREVRDDDVAIDIEFSGVCHSDIHTARSEWGPISFPCVPGHEIVGRVSAIGSAVSGFSVGQRVGVGVYVDSCRTCKNCLSGMSNYCEEGFTGTYNTPERSGEGITQGGYSTGIVVNEGYVVTVPESLDPPCCTAVMCRITLYSPLKEFGAGPGVKVGDRGLGWLRPHGCQVCGGHGCRSHGLSHSESKRDDALAMGAHHFVVTNDETVFQTHAKQFALIINTVSASIDLNLYLELLGLDGTLVDGGPCRRALPNQAFLHGATAQKDCRKHHWSGLRVTRDVGLLSRAQHRFGC